MCCWVLVCHAAITHSISPHPSYFTLEAHNTTHTIRHTQQNTHNHPPTPHLPPQTPRPTRAEATDVANAILDGADGLLLGAETMRGKYPVTAVKTVLGICREAEAAFDHAEHYEYLIGDLVEVGVFGELVWLWLWLCVVGG